MRKLVITLRLFQPAPFHGHSMITSTSSSRWWPAVLWPYSFRPPNTKTRLGSHVPKQSRSRRKEKFWSLLGGWKFTAAKPPVRSRKKTCRPSDKANASRQSTSKSKRTRPSRRLAIPKRPSLVRWRPRENLSKKKHRGRGEKR